MPRAGGEADKLGNRYESLWTVDAVLDLLGGNCIALVVEPIGEETQGIEFTVAFRNGEREVHSIKRQQADGNWTIGRLTETQANGRSILGDLLRKASSDSAVVFSSGTSATQLEELADRARKTDSLDHFLESVQQNNALFARFRDRIVPLCGSDLAAHSRLARLRVRTKNEPELRTDVERRIRSMLRRTDHEPLDDRELAPSIGNFVLDHAGRTISAQMVWQWLQSQGLGPLQLIGDRATSEQIEKRNRLYLGEAEGRLINDDVIQRSEAEAALDQLLSARVSVMLEGNAGGGKTCAFAQVVRSLKELGVPCLAIRLDRMAETDRPASTFGRNLGLPESPAITLGEYAGGQPSVLCIDQLDAVSVVSARQQWAWDTFSELLEETQAYPNMRVLFCCRTFDLEQDPRLRRLVTDKGLVTRIPVAELDEQAIRSAIESAGLGHRRLELGQMRILATPLHLYLFLEGSRSDRLDFMGPGELYERYWRDKSRALDQVRPGAWTTAVSALSELLSDRESLSAPMHLLDEHVETLDVLASEGVVSISDDGVGFFHESFFDYAFARTFERRGRSLVDWLKSDAQFLFRRSQVRQVLGFLRRNGVDSSQYLETLAGLLQDTGIRFHIKQLVLDWLGGLADPSEREWWCLEASEDSLGERRWDPLRNSIAWFDLLSRLGVWNQWLGAEAALRNRACWLLEQEDVLNARADLIVPLVRNAIPETEDIEAHLWQLANRARGYTHQEMRELLLELVSVGADERVERSPHLRRDLWAVLHALQPRNPAYVIQVLVAWYDREAELGEPQHQLTVLGRPSRHRRSSYWSEEVIKLAAEGDARRFAHAFWPRIGTLEQAGPAGRRTRYRDRESAVGQLRDAVAQSLRQLAIDDPDELDVILAPDGQTTSEWMDTVVVQAWSANPGRYADRLVEFLLDRPIRRLALSGAHGIDSFVAASRIAIASVSPTCSDESFWRLEDAVLHTRPQWERMRRQVGRTELTLLRCMPLQRLRTPARRRLQELERRFPNAPERGAPDEEIEDDDRVGYASSPIPPEAVDRMTDDHWMGAVETYSGDELSAGTGRNTSGAGALAHQLERVTRADPVRFARFAHQLQATHAPVYMRSILRGLTLAEDGSHRQPEADLVIAVVRRMIALQHPMDREVAWALRDAGGGGLPEDILAVLIRMATTAPDPRQDDWSEEGETAFSEPEDQGLNSERGAAAAALASALFRDRGLWRQVKPAVITLAGDSVLAVRACAVDCFVAVMESDWDDAFTGFRLLLQDADRLLGSRPVQRFLRYAMYQDYAAVRPILLQMLEATEPNVVECAARLITLVGLDEGTPLAQPDAARILEMGVAAREGAAQVYAQNAASDVVGTQCRQRLVTLFVDPDAGVRQQAARCWLHIEADEIPSYGALMREYIRARAFEDPEGGRDYLPHCLSECGEPLPTEFCEYLERSLALRQTGGTTDAFDMYGLPDLAMRMYQETQSSELRSRILDTIDEMMKIGVFGVTEGVMRRFER
ncbi:MAG: hypothetical protein OXT70_03580 [Chloroflexota bacterium]|nr:hypothetical protein [Chloroflexota bacterium]